MDGHYGLLGSASGDAPRWSATPGRRSSSKKHCRPRKGFASPRAWAFAIIDLRVSSHIGRRSRGHQCFSLGKRRCPIVNQRTRLSSTREFQKNATPGHPPEHPHPKRLPEYPLSMNPKEIFAILKKTASDWMEDQARTLGAALAYYTVFSLAPLLIIAIAIAGLFFGREAAQGQIFDQLRGLLGEASGKAMQDMVQNANRETRNRCCCDPNRGCDTAFWCIGCFRAVADLAQCNLGRATEARAGCSRHYPGSHSLLRLYPGNWVPASGFPSSHSSHRSRRRVVRRYLGPGMETFAQILNFVISLGADHSALRHDI